jgi:glycine/D-amino acid oxidase-like deaminating enzyme
VLDPQALAAVEPALTGDLFACRLQTGYPAHPAAATERFAVLAAEAGVTFRLGTEARLVVNGGGLWGVEAGGERLRADGVLVAAGPWTAGVIGAPAIPIRAQWGVTVQVQLAQPVRHRIEEWGSDHRGAAHFEATPLGEVTVCVAAGHGPLGISLGPASARIAADALLGVQPAPCTWRLDRPSLLS